MKICNRCNTKKDVTKFVKNKSSKDGFHTECKQCTIERSKYYRKTKDGVITTLYNAQVQHSNDRCHDKPSYSKDEFKKHLLCDEVFHFLYDCWVKSGYDRWKKPSVDRIDSSKPYSFDNIQVIEWKENSDLGRNESNARMAKKVAKMDKNMNTLKIYDSVAEAAEDIGRARSNIRSNINGKTKHCGGFIWRYV